jgi:hypothetical protein
MAWAESSVIMQRALVRPSLALSRGNAIVFAEVGTHFARFGAQFASRSLREAARADPSLHWSQFERGLPESTRPHFHAAMRLYFDAMLARPDEAGDVMEEQQRAQMIAWANFLVGLHEQTRLQECIEDAHPDTWLAPQLLARYVGRPQWNRP